MAISWLFLANIHMINILLFHQFKTKATIYYNTSIGLNHLHSLCKKDVLLRQLLPKGLLCKTVSHLVASLNIAILTT